MAASSSMPNFDNKYIVYSHGSKIIDEDSHTFSLGPNYRIITLHVPGKQIYIELARIILEQIDSKAKSINSLFDIGCPIARGIIREQLENSFIKDWLLSKHHDPINRHNLIKDLHNIMYVPNTEITNVTELRSCLGTLDYNDIKKKLNFQIRIYRPNEECPKIKLEFKFPEKLTNNIPGIFNTSDFRGFDLDMTDELNAISKLAPSAGTSSIESVVKFNDKLQYFFDSADIVNTEKEKPFFDTIKKRVHSGLIIILACGTREEGTRTELMKSYKKYLINYNN